MFPTDPKIIEAAILACLEKDPINFRSGDEDDVPRVKAAVMRGGAAKGAALRPAVNRNPFLCGCLDFTERLREEHLIVGYGYRYGRTTEVVKLHHVAGQERRVSIPAYVHEEIRRHHLHRTDAEVIVFHNHPRTGEEPEWLYTLKSLLQDSPIASNADRQQVQQHAFNPVGVVRQIFGQGQVHFYLGESGFVKEFRLPSLLPFLEQWNRSKWWQSEPFLRNPTAASYVVNNLHRRRSVTLTQ
jgi:hypothetical protein